MNKFIIDFFGNEGSTAIAYTLDTIDNINIFKNINGIEPFDKHNFSKEITNDELTQNIEN